jgi:hypothetical protein
MWSAEWLTTPRAAIVVGVLVDLGFPPVPIAGHARHTRVAQTSPQTAPNAMRALHPTYPSSSLSTSAERLTMAGEMALVRHLVVLTLTRFESDPERHVNTL